MAITRPDPSSIADLLRAQKSAQLLAWIDKAIDLARDEIEVMLERPITSPVSSETIYLPPGDTTIFIHSAPLSNASITITDQLTNTIIHTASNLVISSRTWNLEIIPKSDCIVTVSGTIDWPGGSEAKVQRAWEYASAVLARQFVEDSTGVESVSSEGVSVQIRPLRDDSEYKVMLYGIMYDLGRRGWRD